MAGSPDPLPASPQSTAARAEYEKAQQIKMGKAETFTYPAARRAQKCSVSIRHTDMRILLGA